MAAAKHSGCWSAYKRALGSVDQFTNRSLGNLAALVARRPLLVIAVTALISLCLSGGIVRLPSLIESASDQLWVPQNTRWEQYANYLESRFGRDDSIVRIFAEATDGGNVLTDACIRDLFTAMQVLKDVSYKPDDSSTSYSWDQNVCMLAADGSGCSEGGVLSFFDFNETVYDEVARQGPAAVYKAVSDSQLPSGRQVVAEDLFVDFQRDEDGNINYASAFLWQGLAESTLDWDVLSEWSREVEAAWLNGRPPTDREVPDSRFPNIKIAPFVPTTIDDAIGSSVSSDIPLVGAAIALICVFSSLVFSGADSVTSRGSLGLLGIVTVTLSIGATFGLCLFAGIPFTSLCQLLPFLLLGIGVDDMFVILRAMEEVEESSPGLELPERFRACLQRGGMSITVTSVTNCVAFLFGSLTSIPAVKWFCWYAAIGVMYDWALMITFFLGFFVLTERRIQANRYDWLCCLTRAPKDPDAMAPEPPTADQPPKQSAVVATEAAKRPQRRGLLSGNEDAILQVGLRKYVMPFLLHPVTRVAVLLLAAAAIACGVVGATRVKEGLDLAILAPDGHYLQDYSRLDLRFSSGKGANTRLCFRHMDQSDPAIQRKMLEAYDLVLSHPYFDRENSPEFSWLQAFWTAAEANPSSRPYVNEDGTIDQEAFYLMLEIFLRDVQPYFKSKVYLDAGGLDESDPQYWAKATIEVSCLDITHSAKTDNNAGFERKALNDVIDAIEELNSNLFKPETDAAGEEAAFLSYRFYIFWETDRIIYGELMLNLSLALAGIAVISWILLVHPSAVLIIVFCILLVDMLLFAELWLLDIPLTTVSVVNLVLAVGLAVDYSMHVLHTFLSTRGTSKVERVRTTVLDIGTAVLVGVLSTFLGVILLSASSSEIIRTFFKLLMGTVVFGSIVGLVVLPTLLTLVGPGPCLGDAGGAESPADVPNEEEHDEDREKP